VKKKVSVSAGGGRSELEGGGGLLKKRKQALRLVGRGGGVGRLGAKPKKRAQGREKEVHNGEKKKPKRQRSGMRRIHPLEKSQVSKGKGKVYYDVKGEMVNTAIRAHHNGKGGEKRVQFWVRGKKRKVDEKEKVKLGTGVGQWYLNMKSLKACRSIRGKKREEGKLQKWVEGGNREKGEGREGKEEEWEEEG